MTIRDILGDLARKSYQNRKPTGSYLLLVNEALETIRKLILEKKISISDSMANGYEYDKNKGYNKAIDEVLNMFKAEG